MTEEQLKQAVAAELMAWMGVIQEAIARKLTAEELRLMMQGVTGPLGRRPEEGEE